MDSSPLASVNGDFNLREPFLSEYLTVSFDSI